MLKSILAFLFVYNGCTIWGQAELEENYPYYHFKHFGVNEGLSAQNIRQIIQDAQGFLWLATNNGLIRYDGHHFRNYNHKPNDPWSLSSNIITALLEDSRGWLWVVTEDEVLHCMDRKKERFYRFGSAENASDKLPANELGEITEDNVGRIWIRGDQGIICLVFEQSSDGENLHHFPFRDRIGQSYNYKIRLLSRAYNEQHLDPDEEYSFGNEYAFGNENSLFTDSKGNVWIDSDIGIVKFSPSPSWGFEIEDTDSIVPYKTYKYPYYDGGNTKQNPSVNHIYSTIFEDKEQGLWMVTYEGIYKYQEVSEDFRFFSFPDKLQHNAFIQHKGGGIEVAEGDYRSLWIADIYWGATIYDPQNHRLTHYTKDFEGARFGVNSILQDRSGVVWLGTFWGGLYQYDPQASRFLSYHPKLKKLPNRTNTNLRFVKEDSQNHFWLATDTLYMCDRQNGKSQPILLPSEDNGRWIFKNDLLESANGHIWIVGEDLHLFEYDPNTQQFETYKLLSDIYVFTNLLEGNDGFIWAIATDNHLYKIDPDSKEISAFNIPPATSLFFPYSLYQDRTGMIWIGTQEGLYKFDETTAQTTYYGVEQGLSYLAVTSITESSYHDGRFLWLATKGGGLIRMDKEIEDFHVYNTDDSLNSNQLFAIIEDDHQRLWMSSDRGISVFDPVTEKVRNYDRQDGLSTDDFSAVYGGKVYKNAKGELFFSGSSGFIIFDPQALYDNSYPPDVAITDFQIRYQSISVEDEQTPLEAEISQAESIVLPYKDNSISLTFSALQFHAPEKNQYACMLEGYDEEWLNLGTQRQAYYTGLPPGTYTFKVKAANADGVWNENPTNLVITILPPWWRTWWAYLIYSGVLLFVAYLVYLFLKRRWELQNQLNYEQSEAIRLKELDRFKSDLYANITHEFRTPLTVILGIAGQLGTKLEEGGQMGVELIRRNARQLLRLINQMLDLAKLESQSLPVNYIQADVVLYIKYLFESFHSFAETKGIELIFHADPEEFIMDYDPDKLLKIVSNLLSNAIKFTPSGGRVELTTLSGQAANDKWSNIANRQLPNGDFLLLSVKDTGLEIPPEKLDFIFDRFYQVDSTTTREGEGTGIGLTLTGELVKLMGGEIAVESKKGVGTTFSVHLPIHREASKENASISEGAIEEQTVSLNYVEPKNSKPIKKEDKEKELLLIIEDNLDVVFYMENCLSPFYRIETANNGQLGIEKAVELIPDLIISDVMMPQKDGFEVCHILKQDERSSHIPIILLTAKSEIKDRIWGLRQGADDYLAKPFDEEELLVRVGNLIELRQRLRTQFQEKSLLKPSEINVSSIDQQFLEKALNIIEKEMAEESFGVAQLCEEIGMSQSQLHRKLKGLLDQSPSQFIRSIRLQRAASLIEKDAATLSEIAFQVGFASQAYFSRTFQQQFGKSPSAYKKEVRGAG